MKILFTQEAWKDFEWFQSKDKRLAKRIKQLLKDILCDPENGIIMNRTKQRPSHSAATPLLKLNSRSFGVPSASVREIILPG